MKTYINKSNSPTHMSEHFVCPHGDCKVHSQQEWIDIGQSKYDGYNEYLEKIDGYQFAKCGVCGKFSIWETGEMIYPNAPTAPYPHKNTPEEVKKYYIEAHKISHLSPRASAMLLRIVIQKLCEILGQKESSVHKSIEELHADGTINTSLKEMLHAVRIIGNSSAHLGTIDLDDESEEINIDDVFDFINSFIEHTIVTKKKVKSVLDRKKKPEKEVTPDDLDYDIPF